MTTRDPLLAGEEASQAARRLARHHPGRPGGLARLAGRIRGARLAHYELQPRAGAGAPAGPAAD